MTNTLQVQYCNGYVDYTVRQHIPCGMIKVDDKWMKADNPFKYQLAYETCPRCTEKELDQMGVLPSELEKILSMSG